jgi:soluble P-type ATPase
MMLDDLVEVRLPSGATLLIESTVLGGEEKVAAQKPLLQDVLPTVQEFTEAVTSALVASAATSMTVEFGLQFGLESGRIIAVVAKASANVNLKVTLNYENGP